MRFYSIFLLLVISFLTFGCEANPVNPADFYGGKSCESQTDCQIDELCIDKLCLKRCNSNLDCQEGKACVEGVCETSNDGDIADSDKIDKDVSETTDTNDSDKTPTPQDGDLTDKDIIDTDKEDDLEKDTIDSNETGEQGECTTSKDCGTGMLCISKECIEGCIVDKDCKSSEFCKIESLPPGECVECLNHSDCKGNQICIDGSCRLSCFGDMDCIVVPDSPYCEKETGTCVNCYANNQCGDREVCESNQCVKESLRCKIDSDCKDKPGKPYCLDPVGECVQCAENSHCKEGYNCISSKCVPGCVKDKDCGDGLYCLDEGEGVCVECLLKDHCVKENWCISNSCTDKPCEEQSDCLYGTFCHPKLEKCMLVPEGGCMTNYDCPGSNTICDYMTHKGCIVRCNNMPYCSNGLYCDMASGKGCFECISDTHCPGTKCNPNTYSCHKCYFNTDCTKTGWKCDVTTGKCIECSKNEECKGEKPACDITNNSCVECLENRHCKSEAPVCDQDSQICVECMSNTDCKDPTKPTCSNKSECIPTCTDECAKEQIKCDENDKTEPIRHLICSDIDDDPCLEWADTQNCKTNQTCKNDVCVCATECTQSETACVDGNDSKIKYCRIDSYKCPYWTTDSCPYGLKCSNGECRKP